MIYCTGHVFIDLSVISCLEILSPKAPYSLGLPAVQTEENLNYVFKINKAIS